MPVKKSIYFPNLNGLRFIAAFMVILHHFEIEKVVNEASFWGQFVISIGKLGVILFFALSGFLITFLLLEEKKINGSIRIRDFYIRRILRIWPLYYLIVLGSLFVFNSVMYLRLPELSDVALHTAFIEKLILFLLILPNVAYGMGLHLPYAEQTWSIGVEEQFYIIWPLLFSRTTKYIKMLLAIIFVYLILKVFVFYVFPAASFFFVHLCFDIMAMGGIGAYLAFSGNKVAAFLFNKKLQFLVYILTLALLISSSKFGLFTYEVYGLLFTYIILNAAVNPNVIFNLEHPWVSYLGKISYGLYMYHYVAIRLSFLVVGKVHFLGYHWIHFLLTLGITILISAISYRYFEYFFIKQKARFSSILSGNKQK